MTVEKQQTVPEIGFGITGGAQLGHCHAAAAGGCHEEIMKKSKWSFFQNNWIIPIRLEDHAAADRGRDGNVL